MNDEHHIYRAAPQQTTTDAPAQRIPFKHVLYCSFCHASEHEIRFLVAGRSGYICNECAALAHEIMSTKQASL